MEKKIKLKLKSQRYEIDTDNTDIFAGGQSSARKSGEKASEPDVIELTTDGIMKSSGGRTELSYDESELSGLDGSKTLLIFDNNEPDVLTMIRRGTVNVTMVFSPGLRHICNYENMIMPFEIMLMTHSLKNRLLDDGQLELEYSTELAGSNRARTRLSISIRDVEDTFEDTFEDTIEETS